jgi:hypothetical protein
MLAIHAALWGSTGSWEMLVFHTLSAGNIGQLGAPGNGVPADAGRGAAATSIIPPLIIPVASRRATAARFAARTARFDISIMVPRFRPYTGRSAAAGIRSGMRNCPARGPSVVRDDDRTTTERTS